VKGYITGSFGIPYKMSMSIRKYTEWRKGALYPVMGGLAEFGTQTMKTVKFKVTIPFLKSPYSYKVPALMENLGYWDRKSKYDKKTGDPYDVYTTDQHIKFWGVKPTEDEKKNLREVYETKLQEALGRLYREWREVEADPLYEFAEDSK